MLRSRIENVQVRSPFHFSGVGSWLRIYTVKMVNQNYAACRQSPTYPA